MNSVSCLLRSDDVQYMNGYEYKEKSIIFQRKTIMKELKDKDSA